VLLNDGVRPHQAQQLILINEASTVGEQRQQQVERLAAYWNDLPVPPEKPAHGIDHERTKRVPTGLDRRGQLRDAESSGCLHRETGPFDSNPTAVVLPSQAGFYGTKSPVCDFYSEKFIGRDRRPFRRVLACIPQSVRQEAACERLSSAGEH